jgi:hypothetical protein
MGATTPYGFRFPQATAVPDVPVDMRNLAEDVNDKVVLVDQDIASQADAIAEAALGWVPIASGTVDAVANWVIDATAAGKYPAGTFSMMRLHMRGRLSASEYITLNVNDSLTSDSHRRGWIRRRASDGTVSDSGFGDSTTWRIGYWSGVLIGNTATVGLFETDIASFVSFRGESEFQSGVGTSHFKTETWGRLNENRQVSSLRVGNILGGVTFVGTRYWLEGYRDS